MNLFKLWGEIGVRNTEANQAIDETTGIAEGAESKMSAAFKKIGAAVATYFAVDKIVSFGKEIVNVAAEVSAEASAFEQIMGDYSAQAQEKINGIADATGMVSTRLTPYMTSMTAKFKGLGYDIDEATTLASDGLSLAADAAAFWDKSLDDSMSALNSFINGSYEGGEAIGLFANDTQMAAYAVEQGIVADTKAWSNLDEATKQATRLEYAQAIFEISGVTGQAAKESEQYANVQANLTEKWRQFKAQIGEPLLQNVVLPAMEKLSSLVDIASTKVDEFKEYWPVLKENLSAVGSYISESFSPAIETLSGWFKSAKEALQPFIDEIKNYFDSGQAGKDTTDAFKSAIDFLANSLNQILSFIESVVQGLKNAKQWMDKNETAVTLLAVGIGTLTAAIIAYNIAQAIKNAGGIVYLAQLAATAIGVGALTVAETIATAATTAFGAAVAFLTSPITLVILAIGALIAIAVLLYKNWDTISKNAKEIWTKIKNTISEKINGIKTDVSKVFNNVKTTVSNTLNSVKSTVTSVFNAVKTIISDKITAAKNAVKNAIDAIKGFFNFQFTWPKITLPHFSISPSGWKIGDLLKGSIPKLSIAWYAKGGILNEPTLFDYNPKTGRAKVGGEAGAEAVAPIDTLLGYVRTAVQEENSGTNYYLEKLTSMLAEYLPELLSGSNRQLVLDTGVLVGELAPQMDSTLGDINELRKRGR